MTAPRSDERAPPSRGRRRLWGVLAGVAISIAVVVGLSMILIAMVVDCSAFGGRCPAERPPLLEDDSFGMAGFGAALAVAVPVFLTRPSKQRLLFALGFGLAAALFVGYVARSSVYE